MLEKVSHKKMNILWVIYILCLQTLSINSRTSTLWRLNADRTKIVEGAKTESPTINVVPEVRSLSHLGMTDDQLFNIITSTERYGTSWIKHEVEFFCANCQNSVQNISDSKNHSQPTLNSPPQLDKQLSCGKPVNFTYYGHLVGVINREKHPFLVEPDAIVEFIKKFRFKDGTTFDVTALEKRLRHIKKEKRKSIQLYNQLGNYWRIKGEPSKAIECFRKGLALSPHNSEILLNLAKVLFHLQYLDDAIYLTGRSLEVTPPEKGAWQQYFTLGDIFKVYGHYHEATMHLRHSLELNPGFEPAVKLLQEMEGLPSNETVVRKRRDTGSETNVTTAAPTTPNKSSSTPYTTGCKSAFGDYIRKHAVQIGGCAMALAVIQLIGIFFSCHLVRQLKNGYYST